MKAAIVERPGALSVRQIPVPAMGEYDALCRIEFGATCSGTDQHLIHGRFPWPVHYPTVLGHESVGRVTALGARVRNLRVGDLVSRVGTPADPAGAFDVNWGGFVEYGLATDYRAARDDGQPPAAWQGARIHQVIPPDIDPAGATMIITWRETLSFVTRMGVGSGARLLVLGSGGNGLAFAAHAAHRGAARIAMVGSDGRRETALAAGVGEYFDYRAADVQSALRDAQPDGFDFVIDAVGQAGLLDAFLGYAASDGTVAIYGVDDWGACTLNPTRARGSFRFFQGGYDEEEAHEAVIAAIRAGALRADLWLGAARPFPLDEIGAAFEAVASRRCVKALVEMNG